jgi:hypothetical protein
MQHVPNRMYHLKIKTAIVSLCGFNQSIFGGEWPGSRSGFLATKEAPIRIRKICDPPRGGEENIPNIARIEPWYPSF